MFSDSSGRDGVVVASFAPKLPFAKIHAQCDQPPEDACWRGLFVQALPTSLLTDLSWVGAAGHIGTGGERPFCEWGKRKSESSH